MRDGICCANHTEFCMLDSLPRLFFSYPDSDSGYFGIRSANDYCKSRARLMLKAGFFFFFLLFFCKDCEFLLDLSDLK